jgi:hypothetical protein
MGTIAFIVATGIFLVLFAFFITWKEKKEGLAE